MGFPVPFASWMRSGWNDVVRDVLLDRRTRERGIVNPAAVQQLVEATRSGRRNGADALWALVNLELWYRTFIDGEGVQTLPVPQGIPARAGAATGGRPYADVAPAAFEIAGRGGPLCPPAAPATESLVGAGFSRRDTEQSFVRADLQVAPIAAAGTGRSQSRGIA
jgi:hypothetical protein